MQQRFDKFLDYVCGDIISDRERENTRNELYDHLMCTYECNLAQGMDEEHAAIEAENSMGDRNAVRAQLEQVHASFPELDFKKALALVTVGFVFMSFMLEVSYPLLKEVIQLFGMALVFAGTFCLRKASKRLGQSFAVFSAQFALFAANIALYPLSEKYSWLPTVLLVGSYICAAVFWALFALGLKNLTNGCEAAKHPPYSACIYLNAALNIANTILVLLAFSSGTFSADKNIKIEGFPALTFIIVAVAAIVVTLIMLIRANKLLFESGHEYTVESSSGKKAVLVICSFALVFILSGAVDFALAERKAETQPYNTHDISMSDSERDRIYAILSSYGISDDNIALLPDSELQKYSNAVNADKLDDTMKDLIANWNAHPEFSFKSKDIEYNFERHEYCIIIDSGEPHNYIRTLYFLELQDSEQTRNDRKYVDGMIFNYTDATASNYLMPRNMGGEYNGDLFMILTEENDGLVENKPLNIQPDSDASINRINRVEFQLKDGMKIIYAAYLGEPSDDSSKILTANYTVQYVHRKLPIQSPASRALIHQTGISTPAYCRRNDIYPCDVSYESIFKEPFVDSEDEASDFTEDITK